MAELLTKEKQFLKLNQELDKMATTTATDLETPVTPKWDNRFCTFQKSKGPSALLRKQGAGDGCRGISDLTNIREPKRGEEEETNRSNIKHNNEPLTATSFQPGHSTQHYSKQNKCTNSNYSQQTCSRSSNSRVSPSTNPTFTIKYRNPKFLESSSLEVLAKEERSTLRCQTEPGLMGSLSSMHTDDGTSTGRLSQSSYHTVASKKNVSSAGLIKFLKSKIVILEEDHERTSQEISQQKQLLEKTMEHIKTVEQQRDQFNSKNNLLNEQLAKCEKQLAEANKLLKQRSFDQSAQNKELETVRREFKLLTQTNVNLEKRLLRANEDLENVRKTAGEMKRNEREQREMARKDIDIKDTQIKSLKKQRANLLNAYKKQLFLIDNLKRQNILLEQAKMLDIGEKEFAKVLDWDIKR